MHKSKLVAGAISEAIASSLQAGLRDTDQFVKSNTDGNAHLIEPQLFHRIASKLELTAVVTSMLHD